MKTLIIKDLAITEELGSKAMVAVRGGNNNRPKYDALIGAALLREASGAVSAYNAVPIQGVMPAESFVNVYEDYIPSGLFSWARQFGL